MGATPLADKPLTDRLLRSWVRCRRRAWLDRHANPDDRLYTAHRTLQLDDQQRSFVALLPGKPGHGQAACERGEAGVVGVRLRAPQEVCLAPQQANLIKVLVVLVPIL